MSEPEKPMTLTPRMPMTDENFHESFDARDWAAAFLRISAANPDLHRDEGTMLAWFANALMRGYDEVARRELESRESSAALAPAEKRDAERWAFARECVQAGYESRWDWSADANRTAREVATLIDEVTNEVVGAPPEEGEATPPIPAIDYLNRNIRTLELANAVARHLGLNPADEIPFEELTRRLSPASSSVSPDTERRKAFDWMNAFIEKAQGALVFGLSEEGRVGVWEDGRCEGRPLGLGLTAEAAAIDASRAPLSPEKEKADD
jgi:hypothetical protein